ncbi:hypothetical protein, conserved [Trypanosoma brucei gambiense DAL972]|uniref:Uncharacterized protein n=1 Tax=Trypanosoma brucei gambiense (strain MHOM/CI/86/DAL972) TaxID=679716 RepID=C9ZJC9_TRYB9|nr:hypothetical protein, conserved [Trypanosoma brucei gambiense DAL972]CBH09488.1 hypothetical protein, conserved [Trypanosoma brucei gambiense DAL972]|eukprot:XP_011771793.1 hypothetical protein, conserved [Trypanosoma brucei gambiense DAL972]
MVVLDMLMPQVLNHVPIDFLLSLFFLIYTVSINAVCMPICQVQVQRHIIMKSVAFHFLNMPNEKVTTGQCDATRFAQSTHIKTDPCFMATSHGNWEALLKNGNGADHHNTGISAGNMSAPHKYRPQRPVFLSQLLRAPRVGVSTVMIDGCPCEAICFSGRVVRCERVTTAESHAARDYTAMLVSDNTGMIAVIQYDSQLKEHNNECDVTNAAHGACAPHGEGTHSLRKDDWTTETSAAEAMLYGDSDLHDRPELCDCNCEVQENDYVFVVGRLTFADISKDACRVVKGMQDFISSTSNNVETRKRTALPVDSCSGVTCVRGTVRRIDDVNEIHYWFLSALETHLRLVNGKTKRPTATPATEEHLSHIS